MTTKDVLIAAKAKVAQGWTQGQYARDAGGCSVDYEDDIAVCWCMAGAVNAVAPYSHETTTARRALRDVIGEMYFDVWNDAPGRTQSDVLAAFDKAIALVEEM